MACTIVLVALLLAALARSHSAFPGSQAATPLGWFGWYDQGEYLKQLQALMRGERDIGFTGTYPPGFMLVLLPLALLLRAVDLGGAEAALILGNLGLVALALSLIAIRLGRVRGPLFLAAFCLFIAPVQYFSAAFVAPWSSSLTLVVGALAFWLLADNQESRRTPRSVLVILGAAFALLLHTRPQDFVLLGACTGILVCLQAYRHAALRPLLFPLVIGFVVVESLIVLGFWGFPLGNSYGQSHSFVPSLVPLKAVGLMTGDASYGWTNKGLLTEFPILGSVALVVLVAGALSGGLFGVLFLLGWMIIYLSFSDLGPHNFIQYGLFHYIKTLFVVSLAALFLAGTPRVLLAAVSIALVTAFARVQPVAGNSSPGEADWCSTGLVLDRQASAQQLSSEFFSPPSLLLNGQPLKPFGDYRMFAADSLTYVHFFHAEGPLTGFQTPDFPSNTPTYCFNRELVLRGW
ncbi:hypothetical protein [Pseudomarimonas salicorniae]|uniref:Dolichyl-phosphate-mannose-protein mannosyltransferase n=1 Tax=Pseudomarimonas salicorniae TaxID=2933270 RepID=A0ABT0GJS5_9GAMM|nr:hypothetical protein [Lysobacter sp. CAU 1642]MCK7594464.1 hypothetical protein [Lysobacter sp. CAU 1642]